MVQLRLYPSLDDNESVKIMNFSSLEEALQYAEYLVRSDAKLNLRDFFTIEVPNESSNIV